MNKKLIFFGLLFLAMNRVAYCSDQRNGFKRKLSGELMDITQILAAMDFNQPQPHQHLHTPPATPTKRRRVAPPRNFDGAYVRRGLDFNRLNFDSEDGQQ